MSVPFWMKSVEYVWSFSSSLELFECVHDVYSMDVDLKLLHPSVHFCRINYFDEQILLVTFLDTSTKCDRYCPCYWYLTLKVDQNISWPTFFLFHGNGLPDKIMFICLAQERQEMHPWTHSWMLSKNGILKYLWRKHVCTCPRLLQNHVTCMNSALVYSKVYISSMNPVDLIQLAINKYLIMGGVPFLLHCF